MNMLADDEGGYLYIGYDLSDENNWHIDEAKNIYKRLYVVNKGNDKVWAVAALVRNMKGYAPHQRKFFAKHWMRLCVEWSKDCGIHKLTMYDAMRIGSNVVRDINETFVALLPLKEFFWGIQFQRFLEDPTEAEAVCKYIHKYVAKADNA